MRSMLHELNPINRLGKRSYSFWAPFLVTTTFIILSEFYVYVIAKDPMLVGVFAIFLFVALILYFSFRDGIRGGVVTSVLTVIYYLYIIYTRNYTGQQLISGIETTIILGILYLILSSIIGWLKQTIDVLLESESNERRRLQAIIEQLPVGVVITNAQGRVIRANKKLEQIMGISIPEGFTIEDKQLLETRHKGKSITPSQGPLAQALQTGKPVIGREYMITRKDGRQIYLQVSAAPIHNREGKIIAAASISTDVTSQKEMEKRKDDFVNMASHELKTPITSMKLYIETLMNKIDTDDEKVMKILSRIKYQTENLQELVSDLLDVSRLQTGKLTFNKEIFYLDDLIEETVQGLQESAPAQRIMYDSKRRVKVQADRFRLYQVLTNLLTNAIKYSPEGGEIKIKLQKQANRAIVSVQDYGIGIPREQQKKIFDRLYQVTDQKEKTFPGLGMGLYISKEIMKRHRGNIWVESQKDRGSTFYFSLPIKQT